MEIYIYNFKITEQFYFFIWFVNVEPDPKLLRYSNYRTMFHDLIWTWGVGQSHYMMSCLFTIDCWTPISPSPKDFGPFWPTAINEATKPSAYLLHPPCSHKCFFGSSLCCSQSGNDPQEEDLIARFIYKLNIKVKHPSVFQATHQVSPHLSGHFVLT
jgi:hypothetical protein